MEWQGAVWPLLPLVGKSHSSLSLQVHKPSPAAEQPEEGAPSLGEAPAKAEVRKEFRFTYCCWAATRGVFSAGLTREAVPLT